MMNTVTGIHHFLFASEFVLICVSDMEKLDLEDFYNDGFGWVCKHCEREIKNQTKDIPPKHSRLMREGEAESKQPKFSNVALAKWMDKAERTLMCPRCGITELADKS